VSEQPGREIIFYQSDGAPTIDVRLISDTVWLSLNQLTDLLRRDNSTIYRHISNVFAESELERPSVVAEFATTVKDGKTYQVEPTILMSLYRLIIESNPGKAHTIPPGHLKVT